MKKTSIINLVLVASITASCGKSENEWDGGGGTQNRKVYLRSDTTAAYSQRTHHHGGVSYYAFRPYRSSGSARGNAARTGYYSNAIHTSSNVGHNSSKASISRGGFGRSSFHVSS